WRPRATVARRGRRSSTAAPSTSWTSCPRSKSRSWLPTISCSPRWTPSPARRAPAASATARSSSPTSSTSCASGPAKPAPPLSDTLQHRDLKGIPNMATAKDIQALIKEKDVKYVDVRFTDMRGKMQHVTFDIDLVDDDFLTDGTMFDGSSIAGWKAINESDMKLRPDLSSANIDPFYQQNTLFLFCDVLNPDTNTPYNRDPRSIAKSAMTFMKSAGVGDTVYFGPEAEFFIFDDVRWNTAPHDTGYSYDSTELPVSAPKSYPEGNMGHRPGPKGGYFPVNP